MIDFLEEQSVLVFADSSRTFWASMVIDTCAVAANDMQREVQKSIGLLKFMNDTEIELI